MTKFHINGPATGKDVQVLVNTCRYPQNPEVDYIWSASSSYNFWWIGTQEKPEAVAFGYAISEPKKHFYIDGACTWPDFRNQGRMIAILKHIIYWAEEALTLPFEYVELTSANSLMDKTAMAAGFSKRNNSIDRYYYLQKAPMARIAAVETLRRLGYTYEGGEMWKPTLGKAPDLSTSNEPTTFESFLYMENNNLILECVQQKLGDTSTAIAKHDLTAHVKGIVEEVVGSFARRNNMYGPTGQ